MPSTKGSFECSSVFVNTERINKRNKIEKRGQKKVALDDNEASTSESSRSSNIEMTSLSSLSSSTKTPKHIRFNKTKRDKKVCYIVSCVPIKETDTICRRSSIKSAKTLDRKEGEEVVKGNSTSSARVKSFGLPSQPFQPLKGKQSLTPDLPDLKMVPGGFDEVKCASIDRLVERLTAKEFPPGKFATTFLLTYPTFMTSSDLIARLAQRFHSLHPSNNPGIVHNAFDRRNLNSRSFLNKKKKRSAPRYSWEWLLFWNPGLNIT